MPLLLLLSLFYFSQVDRKSGSKNIPNPPFPPLQLGSSFLRKESRNSDKNGVLHTLSPAKMSIFLPVFESFVFFVCQGVTCPSYFFFLVAGSLHPEKKNPTLPLLLRAWREHVTKKLRVEGAHYYTGKSWLLLPGFDFIIEQTKIRASAQICGRDEKPAVVLGAGKDPRSHF